MRTIFAKQVCILYRLYAEKLTSEFNVCKIDMFLYNDHQCSHNEMMNIEMITVYRFISNHITDNTYFQQKMANVDLQNVKNTLNLDVSCFEGFQCIGCSNSQHKFKLLVL